MKKNILKVIIVLTIILLFILFYKMGWNEYLNLKSLKENYKDYLTFYERNTLLTLTAFFLLYVLTTALSIPGATILTLAAGALFGLTKGVILVSFASTLGATLAFLSSRFLLRDYVAQKFNSSLKKINEGIQREGLFYLFTIRLIPILPFFVINLGMGLTQMNLFKYMIVSQIAMFPATIIYVNAGLQLSEISSLSQILSLDIILSFVALGLFPLVTNKFIQYFRSLKAYKNFKKPKKFDYNLIVIGAGSGGLVSAYIAAAVKAKVLLIEKNSMGGDCLNTGCVPSKALIKAAKVNYQIKEAHQYGIDASEPQVNFSKVMKYVHESIKEIEPHDSIERYESLGVQCVKAQAQIVSPWEVKADGQTYTTKNIIIATGASPIVPPIKGLDKISYLTSENLWQLQDLPNKLLILGGGPIGCEMAQSFARLGSQVTLIEKSKRIMAVEDKEVSHFIEDQFKKENIVILTKTEVLEIKNDNSTKKAILSNGESLEFDHILIAIGRKANTHGFGLEDLGIQLRENKTINTNMYLQTNIPNIYACGDVTGPYQLTHAASHQAWHTSVNALFGTFKRFSVNYDTLPKATYTHPEVASVGLNEQTAQKDQIDYELTTYSMKESDRAITENENSGMIRVLTKKGSDRILGATIVSHNASDMITEFVSAMKHGYGLEKILGTIHAYPTMSEANKALAGIWKQKQTSPKIFKILEKFHQFTRS